MSQSTVYLDHNATTPLDGRVLEAMLPYLEHHYGNPSSLYRAGREARSAIERAREQVADLAGAHPSQVIFTSGGTEANNSAIKGVVAGVRPGTLAISGIEHASVAAVVKALAADDWRQDLIDVDAQGRLSAEAVAQAMSADCRLVSVMWANNETGVLQDIAAIAETVRRRGAWLHTDAVQGLGKVAVDFNASGAHLMSLSAHKLYGPKGIGALIVDKSLSLTPLVHGGGQEQGRRGGTENVAAIVGFGQAAELARLEFDERYRHLLSLRERLEHGLRRIEPGLVIFGEEADRLPNTVFCAVAGIEGETLIGALDGQDIAIASGSACGSHHSEPSPVLRAMGVDAELARCAVRVSVGKDSSEKDVDRFLQAFAAQVKQFRSFAATAW